MDLHSIIERLLAALHDPAGTLENLTNTYGTTTYVILAVVVFCETGLVVTPFLPGDSLLFAIGAFSMRDNSTLNPFVAGVILTCACLLGDNVNYQLGKAIGPRVMKSETSRLFNKKHLQRTQKFFEKYGGKTVILARFVPIVRTFAPFVAGAGAMPYKRFVTFSIASAILWVTTMMGCGVVLGQIDFVKKHFDAVVVMIIFVSVVPMLVEFLRSRGHSSSEAKEAGPGAPTEPVEKAAK